MQIERQHRTIVTAIVLFALIPTGVSADNECQSHSNKPKCLEEKIDKERARSRETEGKLQDARDRISKLEDALKLLAKRVESVEGRLSALPTTEDIEKRLTGVKIDWAAHPSVCLRFSGWTSKPEIPAYTSDGCNGGDFIFNIHK